MIKLINKDNAIVGMVVNGRGKDNSSIIGNSVIDEFNDDMLRMNVYGKYYSYLWNDYYFSLVSMPERRKLTWDYVKEHIDEVPGLVFYADKLHYRMTTCSSIGVRNNDLVLFLYDEKSLYIDPPHPEIPEVPEPWLPKIPEPYKNIGKVSVRNGFISFSLTEFFNLDRKLDFDLYIKEGE